MDDSGLIIAGFAVVLGLVLLIAWFFRKIARGEIGISVNTALLALLAAILLVPFGMNFSAHLISSVMQRSGDTEPRVSVHSDY
ncbi:MAG: hypothetical protein H0X43_12895 [Nitrosospira sp.]|nr:hypothetical protein [Nitrosospira sp.]